MKIKNFYKILDVRGCEYIRLIVNEQGLKEALNDCGSYYKTEGELSYPCLAKLIYDTDTGYVYLRQLDAQTFVERFLNSSELRNRDKPFDIVELLDFYSIHHTSQN